MNRLFSGLRRRKSFDVNKKPPTFRVYYLGNIQTSLTRGEGCADRPSKLLWDMHVKNNGRLGRKLKLTITTSGLEAENCLTHEITKYSTNRIAYYCVANKLNSKMFVWVYRHVNTRSGLTTELRCHACLCSTEEDAKTLATLLHQRLQITIKEYIREKYRRQIIRLETPKRLCTLSSASNYREPLVRSMSTIGVGRLDAINEDIEENMDKDRALTETDILNSNNTDPEILVTLKQLSLDSSDLDSLLSSISTSTFASGRTNYETSKTSSLFKKKLLFNNALSDIL